MKNSTTDPQNELFDVVDGNDRVIGTATRREVHADKNLIHRSVSILVYNKKGELYFQKRSATKDTDPSKWTISCSGHVTSVVAKRVRPLAHLRSDPDFVYEDAAHRELLEELGVDMPFEPVVKFICEAPKETEVMMVFQGYHDGPFRLNSVEIDEGTFFTQKELLHHIKEGKIELSFMAKKILEEIGWM